MPVIVNQRFAIPFKLPFRASILSGALALGLMSAAANAAPDQKILALATQAEGPAWKLVETLVNIDSGTFNEQGLNRVADIAADELTRLGATVTRHPATPALGSNLVATLTGTGKGRILLVAHMDTVFPDGAAKERPFHITDGRAYGPGVMDDKGGIVMGVYALRMLQQLGFKNYAKITFILNTNEETGSAGTRGLIASLAKEHDVALNLEPGRVADGLVIWRKGSADVEVDVKGRAAHAGVAPDSGRNAAMEVAHQILQLGTLGDKQKQTTVNFTVLKAGERSNVIPDHAIAQGDVRAATSEEFDRVEKDLARLSQNKLIPDTEVKVTLKRSFPPMPQNSPSDALAARAQAIYGELGRKLTLEGSGGAADSSLTAGAGTPSLDGFGIVGGGIHTPQEYAEVASMAPRLYLLTRMLIDLGAGKPAAK
jgi:glutamate carboxypeptidase